MSVSVCVVYVSENRKNYVQKDQLSIFRLCHNNCSSEGRVCQSHPKHAMVEVDQTPYMAQYQKHLTTMAIL